MRRPGDRSRKPSGGSGNNHGVHKTARRNRERERNPNHINEMLKLCLEKVCALQEDLAREESLDEDPQAAGYTACAMETIRFLAAQGLAEDHPMVKVLTERLFGDAS